MRHFSASELKDYLQDHQPLLLDVREPWEFATCHIPDSTLVPMRDIPLQAKTLDPRQEIVVICHHGVRSLQVARFLEHMGYNNLINLSGGVDAWAKTVDPAMPTY